MEERAKRVLIAEEDRFLRHTAARVLRHHGFEVSTAGDGEEAIERIRTDRPDLVLLDVPMPRVHGLEVMRVVRADGANDAVKIVVVSDPSPDVDADHCRHAGATDFLVKADISLDDLVRYVRRATGETGLSAA